jgi:enolase
MSLIETIHSRQILDSRGLPTVEVDIVTQSGIVATASVPSGASTGSLEAHELRDNNPKVYMGKGVTKALENIQKIIAPSLIKKFDVRDQSGIDAHLISLDGTPNKSHLGANAILAISLAAARAAALELRIPLYRYIGGITGQQLPVPLMNIINGGAHANNGLEFQEFMLVPHGFSNFSDALRCGSEIFHTLKKILSEKGLSTAVGDEGGFAPSLKSNEEALSLLIKATQTAGYIPGEQVGFALDVAATSFFHEGRYVLEGKKIGSDEMIKMYEVFCAKYPVVSIEDGLEEEDWKGWKDLTKALGHKVQLVGDDLFVTNHNLLQRGISEGIANSILIKPNQIGTLTETLLTIRIAHANNYTTVLSHRSGETEDTFIADIACAVNAGQIKTGSLSRTDRTSKYNRLLRISEDISANNSRHFVSPFSKN